MKKLISFILLIAFIFTQSALAQGSAQLGYSCMRVQELSETNASMAGEMQEAAVPEQLTPEELSRLEWSDVVLPQEVARDLYEACQEKANRLIDAVRALPDKETDLRTEDVDIVLSMAQDLDKMLHDFEVLHGMEQWGHLSSEQIAVVHIVMNIKQPIVRGIGDALYFWWNEKHFLKDWHSRLLEGALTLEVALKLTKYLSQARGTGASGETAARAEGVDSNLRQGDLTIAEYMTLFRNIQREIDATMLKVIRETAKDHNLAALVIDPGIDEKTKRENWRYKLQKFGMRVFLARTAQEAKERHYFEEPGLILVINNDKAGRFYFSSVSEFVEIAQGLSFRRTDDFLKIFLFNYIVSNKLKRNV